MLLRTCSDPIKRRYLYFRLIQIIPSFLDVINYTIGSIAVTYTGPGYRARAEECARLASLTNDQILRAELLKLRQSYLIAAERLQEMEGKPPEKRL